MRHDLGLLATEGRIAEYGLQDLEGAWGQFGVFHARIVALSLRAPVCLSAVIA
jgi:hypothetical protein